MDKKITDQLLSYLKYAEDIQNLRKGLYFIVWLYLQENIDTGMDEPINGKFLEDFQSLLEVLVIIEHETK